MAGRFKIVVLDDDPTGSQTVHSCPLLLKWDPATLLEGLRHPSPLLFVLANTRALAPEAAAERVRAICQALKQAIEELAADGADTATPGIGHWLIVSRGDSTLRGHFPLELEEIAAALPQLPAPWNASGDPTVDAHFLVPAFLPGGRTTVDEIGRAHV